MKPKKVESLLKMPFVSQQGNKRKIDWDNPINLIPLHVAVEEYPFHAKVLARMTGMTVGQVYYRLRQHGVSLNSLRDGLMGSGLRVIEKYEVKHLNVHIVQDMVRTHEGLIEKKTPKKRSA